MAKALGIGGIFFKSQKPNELRVWYEQWLKFPKGDDYGVTFTTSDPSQHPLTVWSPFREDTSYFDPSDQSFMINLVVDDLDEALSQVAEGGAEVMNDREDSEYGRFGWFIDPEGNKVELWEPPKSPPESSN